MTEINHARAIVLRDDGTWTTDRVPRAAGAIPDAIIENGVRFPRLKTSQQRGSPAIAVYVPDWLEDTLLATLPAETDGSDQSRNRGRR
jgi:hypothetical protein